MFLAWVEIFTLIAKPHFLTGKIGPSKGWAEMIRKIYEVDPLLCQSYGGWMRVVSFIENLKTIDKIIRPLKFSFEAECSPLPHRVQKDLLIRSKEKGEYF